jgi:tetratricopeptide (TPR) repeat protein
MLRKVSLAALASFLAQSPVGAQTPPATAPVIAVHVAPPALPAPARDRFASLVKAAGQVETRDGPVAVELLVDGSDAALRLRRPEDPRPKIVLLTKIADVLGLLADQKMAFLWAPLTEWAGPTLERMRDRQLTKLQAAAAVGESAQPAAATIESTVRPRTRALLQLAGFLIEIGRAAEAEQFLEERLAAMPMKQDKAHWSEIEWFTVASRIASARGARDDVEGALAEYQMAETMLGNSAYAMNASVNRAALLLQQKRYAEALAVIDPVWSEWKSFRSDDKVSGSERQFAWIRACALEGLGRHSEADEAFRTVLDAKDSHDRDFVIDSDQKLVIRGLVCMRRKDAVKALIRDSVLNDLSPSLLLIFQSAYRPLRDVDFWDDVLSDPALVAFVRKRMRELPPEMAPALNGWRESPPH